MDLLNKLKKRFGFPDFRKGQEEVIRGALNNEHQLVMLPTGSGKSLIYQFIGYEKEGLSIIVSPLLSLIQDQITRLKQAGEKRVTQLTSLETSTEKKYILSHLADFRFLFLSPEMLKQEHVINVLRQIKIAQFVVDEAHCISQWGMDFRPDYLFLSDARKALGLPLTLALTATATPQVRDEIKKILFLDDERVNEHIYSVDRSNIFYAFEEITDNKYERLSELILQLEKPGIIYFSSKKTTEELAERFSDENGYATAVYHGGLNGDDRIRIQERFIQNKIDVIFATSAFGMGVDKSDIRFVIHYHMPGSIEDYLQEVGRCGRDGKESTAVMLYQRGDENIQRYFIDSSIPHQEEMMQGQRLKKVTIDVNPRVVLSHYLSLNGYSREQMTRFFEQRKQLKENQLWSVRNLIQNSQCKREQILHYFDEKLSKKPQPCCSACELKVLSQRLSVRHLPKKAENQFKTFEEIIDELF